jgi:hypothetical protein
MRATDVVRQVLDLLDAIDSKQDTSADVTVVQNAEPDGRFRQILSLLSQDSFGEYANTPNEIVSDVDSVTTLAGGGVNAPKDPKDIRVKDPRGFE